MGHEKTSPVSAPGPTPVPVHGEAGGPDRRDALRTRAGAAGSFEAGAAVLKPPADGRLGSEGPTARGGVGGKPGVEIEAGVSAGSSSMADAATGSSTSATIGYKPGEIGAKAAHEATWSDGQGGTAKATGGVSIAQNRKDGASAGASAGASHTDASGNVSSASGGVIVGAGGVAATAGGERVEKGPGGSTTTTAVSGGVDTSKRTVSVGGSRKYERKTKDAAGGEGGDKTTKTVVSGGVAAGVDEGGALTSIGGNVGVSRGPVTASLAGGIEITAKEPVQVGRQWAVDWSKVTKGGAEVGASGGKAAKGSAKVGGSRSQVLSGREVFPTQEAATVFQKNIGSRLPGDAAPPATAEGALKLDVGESRTASSSTELSAGASVTLDLVTVGASGKASEGDGLTVTRVGKDDVDVTVSGDSMKSGGAEIGAAGIKVGSRIYRKRAEGFTVRFNVTEADGKRAYEAFLAGRKILPGARIVEEVVEQTSGTGTDIDLAGIASGSVTHETTERHVKGEKGKIDRYGGKEASSLSIWGLGSLSTDTAITGTEVNDQQRSYAVKSRVESTDATASGEELAAATGVRSTGASKASGKWTVFSFFTDEDMKEFVSKARAGQVVNQVRGCNMGPIEDLSARLKAARGDSDAEMKAVAAFVAEEGPRAVATIRGNLDRYRPDQYGQQAKQQFDLLLDKDPYFTGPQGRIEIEGRIAAYGKRLQEPNADLKGIVSEAGQDVKQLREREKAISDQSRYTDLPIELRKAEIARTRGYIASLSGLREQAVALLESQSIGSSPAAGAGKERGGPPGASIDTAAELARESATVTVRTAEAMLVAPKVSCVQFREGRMRQTRWVHSGAVCICISGPPRTGLAGFFPWYAMADGFYAKAEEAFGAARQKEDSATEMRAALATAEGGQVATIASSLAGLLGQAGKLYSEAESLYRQSVAAFRRIEDANAEKTVYWSVYGSWRGQEAP